MAGYELPIEADGLDSIGRKFVALAGDVEKASRAVDDLNGNLKQNQTLGGRPMAQASGLASPRPFLDKKTDPIDRADLDRYFKAKEGLNASPSLMDGFRTTPNNGPRSRTFTLADGANQRLDRARKELGIAASSHDPGLIGDAEAKLKRARIALEKQDKFLSGQPKTRDELIMDAFMTSRIGAGGQLFPLVNRLHKAGLTSPSDLQEKFGLNAGDAAKMAPFIQAAAKLALPVAGVAAAAGLAAWGLETSAATLKKGSDAYWLAGGTGKETGALLGLGATGQDAMSLGDALRQGTMGAAFLRSKGLKDFGNRTIDKAGNYVKAMNFLTDPNLDDRRAIWYARDLGMSDKMWMRDLRRSNPGLYDKLQDSDQGSQKDREAEAKYRGQKQNFGNQWDSNTRDFGSPLVETANDFMGANGVGGFLKGLALGPGEDYLFHAIENSWGRLGKKGPGDPARTAPRASSNGNLPYRQNGDEPFSSGGGARAKASASPGFAQQYLDDAFTAQGLNMGAFSIG